MDIITIREKIKSILDSLTSTDPDETNKPFSFAYDVHKIVVDGYPSVSFEPLEDNPEILTNKENERTYQRRIIIRQEVSSDDNDRAEGMNIILNAYKILIEKLDKERQLEGSVVYSNPGKMKLNTMDLESGSELVADILLETIVLNQIV